MSRARRRSTVDAATQCSNECSDERPNDRSKVTQRRHVEASGSATIEGVAKIAAEAVC